MESNDMIYLLTVPYKNMWSQTTWYIFSQCHIKTCGVGTVRRYIMSFDSTCFYMALWEDISCRLTPHVFIYGTVRRYIMSFDSTCFYTNDMIYLLTVPYKSCGVKRHNISTQCHIKTCGVKRHDISSHSAI